MREQILKHREYNGIGSTTFLGDPAVIRRAVADLQKGKRLDLAVAFIGSGWRELIGGYTGEVRVICWLSSTNTDPNCVEDMMRRPNIRLMQRDSMHCKVYLSPMVGAVVGSANLSKAALAADGYSGQDEAAICVTVPSIVGEIGRWFERLWHEEGKTRQITSSDIAAAKVSRAKARSKTGAGAETQDGQDAGGLVPPTDLGLRQAQLRRMWEQRGLGRTLSVSDSLGQVLRQVDPDLAFLLDPLEGWNYMNVGRNGQLLCPDRPSSYDQPIRLTLNKGSLKITALGRAPLELREDCEARLKPYFQMGRKDTKKARENPAVRVEGVTEQLLDQASSRDAIRYLFEKSIHNWQR